MAVYIISDIHGRFDEFMELLTYSNLVIGQDTLINLGDMVNRGPKSYDVVEFFRGKSELYPDKVITIYGNHEEILLSRVNGNVDNNIFYNKKIGGKATEDSYLGGTYPFDHINFIEGLPLYYVLDNYIFFHGGLNLTKTLDEQNIGDLCWDNNKFYTQDTSMFENVFVFGHTPTEYINNYYGTKGNEIWKQENKICVDCTYSKSRKLLLYDLTNDIEYYYSFAKKGCYIKKNGALLDVNR